MIGGGINKFSALHRRCLHSRELSRLAAGQTHHTAYPSSSTLSAAHRLRPRGHARDQVDRFIPITFPCDNGINISHSYSQLLYRFGDVQWRRYFSSAKINDGDSGESNQVQKSMRLSCLHFSIASNLTICIIIILILFPL